MLNLLIVLLIILDLTIFSVRRTLLSPTFLCSLVYTLSAIFAQIGNTLFWHIPVEIDVVLIIVVGIFSMLIGELLGNSSKVLFISNNHNRNSVLHPFIMPKRYNMMIIGFCVFCTFIYFLYLRSTGMSLLEYNMMSNSSNMKGERVDIPLPALLASRMVGAVGTIYTFIIANNTIYYLKTQKKLYHIKEFFPALFIVIIEQVLTSSRSGVLSYVYIYIFSCFTFLVKFKNDGLTQPVIKKLMKILIKIVIAFFIFFVGMGMAMKKFGVGSSEIVKNICKYGGGSILTFNVWLQRDTPMNSQIEKESINGIYTLLNRFGAHFHPRSQIMPFIYSNGLNGNVYGGFKSYFFDFGLLGVAIIQFLLGLIYAHWIKKVAYNGTGYALMLIIVETVCPVISVSISSYLSGQLTFASIMQTFITFIFASIVFSLAGGNKKIGEKNKIISFFKYSV